MNAANIANRTCEAPDCADAATHKVTVAIVGEPETVAHVCRAHDRSLKTEAVRSRPKKPAEAGLATPNVVRCGACGELIGEQSDLDPTLRQGCPTCQAKSRLIEVYVSDSITSHSKVETTVRPGGGKWTVKSKGGDDYTHDLEAWGKRGLYRDQAANLYVETIELWDGSTIVSEAKLTDHRD